MTLKITLSGAKGLDTTAYVTDFFATFRASGFPIFMGGRGEFDGTQFLLIAPLVEGQEGKTQVVIIDGLDLRYNMSGHTLSGTAQRLRLGTLDQAYNPTTQWFNTDAKGLVTGVATPFDLTGLAISNAAGVKGDFHDLIYGLMGGTTGLPPTIDLLTAALGAEAWEVQGTGKADTLVGTDKNDLLRGGAGNDKLLGEAGHDALWGEGGHDQLWGGSGKDLLRGGDQNDSLYGGDGADRLEGESGTDALYGGTGNDSLYGGSGNDSLYGGSNDDWLYGGTGSDRLAGDAGRDHLYGGAGNDSLSGGSGTDRLWGDAGNDSLYGGDHDDQLYGGAGHDLLQGDGGNDTLSGGSGRDSLTGGSGADLLTGGAGADQFIFTRTTDSAPNSFDTLTDFSRADGDRIILRAIDANTNAAGDQNFRFIGTADFSGTARQLRFETTDAGTFVHGDTDGDGTADFTLLLLGQHSLVASDFLL